jgi:uncharacterized protein
MTIIGSGSDTTTGVGTDGDDLLDGIKIIDTDTHLSEPYDLWTSRAPARYRDLVPQIRADENGKQHWFVDGDKKIGFLSATSVIGRDGEKRPGVEFFKLDNDHVHRASYDMTARVEMMDTLGIHAQIMYPNLAGFGNQNFMRVEDAALRLACAQIYNDALAEMQDESGQRVFGMALMPWWDIDAAVAEVERVHEMGLRGVVTCSNPEEAGLPDLGTDAWDPFWRICGDLAMPVNFHIGSSKGNLDFFGKAPWPSFGPESKLAIGSANIFLGNARVIGNLIFAGIPERFPDVRFVSVESGIGWIPFFLEALDWQCEETAPNDRRKLKMLPSEYFRRQFYGCFWFETVAVTRLLDVIGVDNVLFETDFPHPTCLYPRSSERVRDAVGSLDEVTRRKILQDNAAQLYRIPV